MGSHRILGIVFIVLLSLLPHARAQGADDLAAIVSKVSQLRNEGKYAEALPLAERYVALARQKHGEEHIEFATAIGWLAGINESLGRYSEAEQLHKRALAIFEKALGPGHPSVGAGLSNLANVHRAQGRYSEAEQLHKRALAIREKGLGPDHPEVAQSLNNLAELYRHQGRYPEAEPLYRRSLAIREKASGPDHLSVGVAVNNLAVLYGAQGRYAEAEPLHKRALAIAEKALGPDHPTVGVRLNNLADLYRDQGRYAEAEPLYQRALATAEKALGPDHLTVGLRLNNLAGLYNLQGRIVEAESLYKRSLAIREKGLGPDHPDVGLSLNNLAALYRAQRRYAEAEPLYKRALAIAEKTLGPSHPSIGTRLNNLGDIHQRQGRYAEAEPIYKRSLAITEKALGPNHPDVAVTLNNLGTLYHSQGRYAEAAPFYERALAISETLGPEHPNVAVRLNNIAALHFEQRNWAPAADYWRRGTDVIIRRALRGTDDVGRALTGKARSEAEAYQSMFSSLIKSVDRLAAEDRNQRAVLAKEMFQTAQWALGSEAARALAQMAARGAKGDAKLASLIRDRQDLVDEWQKRDLQRSAAISQPSDKRNSVAEAANIGRLNAIDARIADIDKRLLVEAPDYTSLSRPAPLSVEEVQALLRADEALVLFLDTWESKPSPDETYVWVITKTDLRWARSELGKRALRREVAALRCGLDAAMWDDPTNCVNLLKIALDKAPGANDLLPFDHARAHALYKGLFGEIQDIIKDKQLLVIPSGALTQLPFQVLVTAPPSGSDHRTMAWLARDHAITILPAVSSLKALRRVGKPSAAPRPLIGFGNPLLDGPGPRYADSAKLARTKQRCPEARQQQVAALRSPARVAAGAGRMPTRGTLADLELLKAQAPLPETADELCAVAEDVKASATDIRLGAHATEREIKRLSASGELAKYRIVHFATHGVLAGEMDGASEPGLILTPPDKATEDDDGYLSASEIAGLRLDADWVILSACNTAAGRATGADALSGLARAFFYAQARALLVSHWAVDSNATVKLITLAVGETARDPRVGRANALRRAMLGLIDKGEPHEAHPAYWAPFVVVGEGAGPI